MAAAKKTEKTYHVRIQAPDERALAGLPMASMDRGCTGGVRRQEDGSLVLEALVKEKVLQEIRKSKCNVEVLSDVEETGKKRQKQVGKGNRFTGKDWIPRGLGRKIRDEEPR